MIGTCQQPAPGHSSTAYVEFIRLFVAHERRIYAFIVSMLGDLNEADDVLQETSVVLWEKFDQFERGTNFVAWGCRIARHKVLKHLERRQRSGLRFSNQALRLIADEAMEMDDELERRHEALRLCLGDLSERDRMILTLRYEDEASVKTVARSIGRSVHAVYKALPKLHAALMRCVQRRLAGGGLS